MENISVNNLVESTKSSLPRDIKIEFAKNILSSIAEVQSLNPDDSIIRAEITGMDWVESLL